MGSKNTDYEKMNKEAEEIIAKVFPDGVPEWPVNLREIHVLLEKRYVWCKRERIGDDDHHWFIYVGRMFNHTRKIYKKEKAYAYLDGMRSVMATLLKYNASPLPYTTKRKKLAKHYSNLKAAFMEVVK